MVSDGGERQTLEQAALIWWEDERKSINECLHRKCVKKLLCSKIIYGDIAQNSAKMCEV